MGYTESIDSSNKMLRGRPKVELTEKEIKQIELMAGFGLSEEKIALVLEINHRTLRRRKKDSEIVAEAIERGKAKAEMTVAKTLFQMATEGNSLSAVIWYEKTRCGRNEVQKVQHSGAVEGESSKVVVMLPSNGRGDETAPTVAAES